MAEGYKIATAETGEIGLVLAKEKRPDLIILDVLLPGIKGREVCNKLKEDDQTKNIPVVFLTAKASPEDIKAELKAGALAHLTKPVDMQKLSAVINRILS